MALFDGARLARAEVGSGETARRLVESVLRPLAEAISGRRLRTRAKAARTRDVDAAATALDAQLWKLAQDATATLARLGRRPGRADAAHGGDRGPAGSRARRGGRQRAGCAAGHAARAPGRASSARSDVRTTGRTWSRTPNACATGSDGRSRSPPVALCRCGGSEIKPICDGSCARNGFTDRKDPKRVRDQRDSFDGVQLTVFDNRGICQHSGFCTDRLNTVFHTEGAFVTPSGGRMDDIVRAVRDCPSGALSYAVDGVEARDQVDWEHSREPAIEVTKDGPYRITGGIRLTNAAGRTRQARRGILARALRPLPLRPLPKQAVLQRHALVCRLQDPLPDADTIPTLFEWAGGLPALTRMTRLFYEKHVPEDPLLAPLFANMSPDHPVRVARWLSEVFGGPKLYSETYGGYDQMISQHLGKALSEEKRARWVELICRSAQEAGLPNDAEFQAAFRSYIEWGSRIAVENSQPGAKPPPHMPMPRWWWACDATPGSRVSALESSGAETSEAAVELPRPNEAVSFEQHVKPLFRERDRKSMKFAFDLWSYDDVRNNAQAILERVKAGTMPCDGAWPSEWVEVFERWTQSGTSK